VLVSVVAASPLPPSKREVAGVAVSTAARTTHSMEQRAKLKRSRLAAWSAQTQPHAAPLQVKTE
jgi:hypothetical protein